MTLNAFMKSERHLHQAENPTDYANGYRERKASGFGKEMVIPFPQGLLKKVWQWMKDKIAIKLQVLVICFVLLFPSFRFDWDCFAFLS